MQTYKAKNGKKYSVEMLAAKIATGTDTLEAIAARCGQDVADKISKHAAKLASEERNESLTLTGRIVRETEAATLFLIDPTANNLLDASGEVWLPKSASFAMPGAMGGVRDQIKIAGWLARKNGWLK